VVHPSSAVEGRNFRQHAFILEQIRKKEGYIEYFWKNPGEDTERAKALYMTYFAPLDWIISVSSYREEFKDLVNTDDFRESILGLRFGKTGYAYIVDTAGKAVIHPQWQGVNLLEDKTLPETFLREMIARKSGKIRYDWKNPEDPESRNTVVVYNYVPETDWIVACSSYTDEIFTPLYTVRNTIVLALLSALVIALVVTFRVSATLTRPLKRLMDAFAEATKGDLTVRLAHPARDEIGQLAAYFNGFMDQLEAYSRELKAEIGERRQVETALRESEREFRTLYEDTKKAEELYQSLLNSSADAIVIYDMDGRVRYINPAFSQIFGWTVEELTGQRIPFVPESEQAASMAIIRDLIDNGTPCHGFETRRLTRDGRILDVSISGSRYHDHEGKTAGMLAILRDISEKKQLQAQVHHAQRMEAIGTLAGGIAHDFNNLLTGIQGHVSLMQTEIDPQHPQAAHLASMEEYVGLATNLTRQLLGFARGGKYEIRPSDLNRIVRSSAEMFGRTRKEISLQIDCQDNLWPVNIDRAQIEQVLLNLYVNAWQAMSEGGTLFLSTRNVTLDKAFVSPHGAAVGPYVKLSVRDTGCGMDQGVMQRIFDPFFTTKEMGRGTGLGLASAYGIIRHHGGIITVESRKNCGAEFTIFLPAGTQPVEEETGPLPVVTKGRGTILLIDDEKMILDVARQMLERLGYRIFIASNGHEALAVYRERRAEIDLVILDMIMPEMSGGQTFSNLKELDPDVRVLLSSGYSLDGQAREILDRGCLGFIQKPFSMKTLADKLTEIL
jgi:PAS domain S-box-containing protein